MSGFRDKGFGDRLSMAENARKAMQQRFLARPGADDPAVVERREARKAIGAAREARLAGREAQKLAENARMAAEREARETAERAQLLAQETSEAATKAARAAALEIEQKAARDARYAARKARQR